MSADYTQLALAARCSRLTHRFGRAGRTAGPEAGRYSPSALAPRPSALAFTLVELMVVIGIIGLLIAIALPAFSSMVTRSRATHTAATINALSIGLEQFRASDQLGGALPPSYGLYGTGSVICNWVTPHTSNTAAPINGPTDKPLQGANLLAWALVGADMLGTPGFKNVNGAPDNGTPVGNDYGGWTDDTGNNYSAALGAVNGLYAMKPSGGGASPFFARQGPFVDTSKMAFPKAQSSGGMTTFVIDKLDSKPLFSSICFLDTFNQPILYYKANIGKTVGVDSNRNPLLNTGIYNQSDNEYITGGPTAGMDGMDFGAGPNPAPYNVGPYLAGKNHLLANCYSSAGGGLTQAAILGGYASPLAAPTGYTPLKGTMEYHFWNPAVSAAWRTQREDSFILLSAGPDGRFGTADDIGNFPINP
jgi:type II secretory pathway pseudopilin PulG